MGRTLQLAVLALLLSASIGLSAGQEENLYVHVVTADGTARQGISVTATTGGVAARATTNATGWAILAGLQPGTYTVTVSLGDIPLNTTVVEFPSVSSVSLVAPLGRVIVAVQDLAGRPVANTAVTVSSPSGRVEATQRTNTTGYVTFNDLPYSSVDGVGGEYRLRIIKEGMDIGEGHVRLETPLATLQMVAKLLNLDITVLDRAGSQLKSQATVSLRAGNYSQQASLQDGKATLTGVISSEIVGEYTLSVLMKVDTKDLTVFSDKRMLTLDLGLEVQADVGNIVVRTLDDSGNPVQGIVVVVNSASLGAFVGGRTDSQGQLRLVGIPLSTTEAGDYNLTAYRGRTIVSSQSLRLEAGEVTTDMVLRTTVVRMTVVDAAGGPLVRAEVVISDPLTGRNATAITDSSGQARLSVFAGPNDVTILYKNLVVFRKTLNVDEQPLTMTVNSVNFPITISVVDALGRHATDFQLKVSVDGRDVFEGKLSGRPVVITSELPGLVRVDVTSGGRLLARETAYFSAEGRLDIRFSSYVFMGDTVMPFEVVLAAAIGGLLAVVVAFGYRAWRYAGQH
ncbi:MAG: carboxypeptidase-like regulatory domain-containing protein [Nitrososphaerota archaeon]